MTVRLCLFGAFLFFPIFSDSQKNFVKLAKQYWGIQVEVTI